MSVPVRPLRAAAEVTLGRQRSPEHDTGPHMVPYLRAANVKDGRLELADVKRMNFTPVEQSTYALEPGDVLVSEGAGSLQAVGANAVWAGQIEGTVCFQNTLLRLRPRQDVLPDFLAWWARHAYYAGLLASVAGGVNIFHLGASRVRRLPFPMPSIEEQQRIVEYLDTETARIDDLIDEQERLASLLSDRRWTTLFDAVSGASLQGPRQPGPIWVESVPATWQVVPLSAVASLGSGHTPARSRAELWHDCTIPWITTGEVSQLRSDEVEVLTETRELISARGVAASAAVVHPAGTVVLSRTASVGFSAVMGTDMATSQDFATWTCGPKLDPYFLLYCLRAMRPDLLGRLVMGSTHKTIYMPDLRRLQIPLPPRQEQMAIVERTRSTLMRLDETRREIDKQLHLLVEHRQALITAAVTGGLDAVREVA